jgi:hypothetical protein
VRVQAAQLCALFEHSPPTVVSNYSADQLVIRTAPVDPAAFGPMADALLGPVLQDAPADVEALCTHLLGEGAIDLAGAVETITAGAGGLIGTALPFDATLHPDAVVSPIAQSTLHRLTKHYKEHIDLVNGATKLAMRATSTAADAAAIQAKLQTVKDADAKFVDAAIPAIVAAANALTIEGSNLPAAGALEPLWAAVAEGNGGATLSDVLERYQFQTLVTSRNRQSLWFGYLVSSLVSTEALADWLRLNPFLSEARFKALQQLILRTILRSTRIGHINRCLGQCRDWASTLAALAALQGGGGDAATVAGLRSDLERKSQALARILTTKRHYMAATAAGGAAGAQPAGFGFKPQYSVFEYQANIILRKRQVELVSKFERCVLAGGDMVEQLIMGAGKTTVVSPMLSLLLSRGKRLVTLVVPKALLPFSRSILRSIFSMTLQKRIITLQFERSSGFDGNLLQKLKDARTAGSIVICTPSTVKSMMLKFIESVSIARDPDHKQYQRAVAETRLAPQVMEIMRAGIGIMDEVDLILHPLKSELNFPVGVKEPLDFSPKRWQLPIHLIGVVFEASAAAGGGGSGPARFAEGEGETKAALVGRLRQVVEDGYQKAKLQRSPHLILLDVGFYDAHMKPILCEWAWVWICAEDVVVDREAAMAFIGGCRNDHVLPSAGADGQTVAATINALPSKHDIKVLNFVRDWMLVYLPHSLKKIDRVTFGIMNGGDIERANIQDPFMPASRSKLAIPFIGKDVPSHASEFAHPDVTIGLTILAFWYEGLRESDFQEILSTMQTSLHKEQGPKGARPTSVMFNEWAEDHAGAQVATGYADMQTFTKQQAAAGIANGDGGGGGGGGEEGGGGGGVAAINRAVMRAESLGEEYGTNAIAEHAVLEKMEWRKFKYSIGSDNRVYKVLLGTKGPRIYLKQG